MSKPILSQNRKIYLDKGYLMHLTIKWKDVTKNEQARATVMGVYEGKLEIPFTLLFIGHNGEVLKEVTQQGTLEEKSCSAISRFNIKSLLGSLKEEDVDKITVKIEMNDQRLDVPCENDWLRIGTTCLERFHEAIKQNDAKKHPNEKDTYFKWLANNYILSKRQTQDAVQDKFNYSEDDSPYVADPEVFEMEKANDIGQQIHDSIKNKGGMYQVYLDAIKQKGKPMSFKWLNTKGEVKKHAFNSSWIDQKMSKAMPFGAVSAKITKGKITVCEDGSYFVEGILVYESDWYSWKMDAKEKEGIAKTIHDAAIWVGGQNINYDENHKHRTRWNKPAEVWKKGKDPIKDEAYGQMPVKYGKDYYFYILGTTK